MYAAALLNNECSCQLCVLASEMKRFFQKTSEGLFIPCHLVTRSA